MQFGRHQACSGLWLLLMLLAVTAGCGRYSHVNWRNPGTAPMQRDRALAEHDPYPDPDLAPEVVGGRPLGFEAPPTEPAWLQRRDSLHRSRFGYQQSFTAQPVYTTPAYNTPVYPQNGLAPAAQPNYATPGYQSSVVPPQPLQQAPPGYPMQ